MSRYELQLFEYFSMFQRQLMAQPLLLGGAPGSGGGYGGRPGGFVGYLPQTRVSYDMSELATLATPASGTLLDNLNHIRYRVSDLETTVSGMGTGSIEVQMNDILVANGITIVNFEGDAAVIDNSGGKVTVTVSGIPALTVRESDMSPSVAGVSILEISGAVVTDQGGGVARITSTPAKCLSLRLPNTFSLTYDAETFIEWGEVTDEDNYFNPAEPDKISFNRDGWYLTSLNLAVSPPYVQPIESTRYEFYLVFNNSNWNRAYYYPITSGILIDSFSVSYTSLDYITSGEYMKASVYNLFSDGLSSSSDLITGADTPVTTSRLTVVKLA